MSRRGCSPGGHRSLVPAATARPVPTADRSGPRGSPDGVGGAVPCVVPSVHRGRHRAHDHADTPRLLKHALRAGRSQVQVLSSRPMASYGRSQVPGKPNRAQPAGLRSWRPGYATTGTSRTGCTGSVTSPSVKTPPRSEPATASASWPPCAPQSRRTYGCLAQRHPHHQRPHLHPSDAIEDDLVPLAQLEPLFFTDPHDDPSPRGTRDRGPHGLSEAATLGWTLVAQDASSNGRAPPPHQGGGDRSSCGSPAMPN